MSRRRTTLLVAAVALALAAPTTASAAPAGTTDPSAPDRWQRTWAFALRQLARTDATTPPARFPVAAPPRSGWRTDDASSWLAGFLPGQLWSAYARTGDLAWAARARARQQPLAPRRFDTSTHDLGFVLLDSWGQDARLTGDAEARRVVLDAAASLATRWVPAVSSLRSWDGPPGQVTVIVDNLVNLELLLRGAQYGGPAAWRSMAIRHALTSRDQLVRRDGSTWGAVRFAEGTGRRVWRGNIGGATNRSTWARGQAWAVLGYATLWRETRDRRMLAVARRTAGFATTHLPADGVPYWDYGVRVTRHTPRDSSAGAVLASALLDLARTDPSPRLRQRWRRTGLHTLRSLTGPRYLARGTGSPALLLHGRASPRLPDAGVATGDYYLLEALRRV